MPRGADTPQESGGPEPAGFHQAKRQRGRSPREKTPRRAEGNDHLGTGERTPGRWKNHPKEWEEQHPTITKGREACCAPKTRGHWVEQALRGAGLGGGSD